MGLMLIILIAIHEQETPLNALNEQLGRTAPSIYYVVREPKISDRGVREGQGTVTERPPPEHMVDDGQLGEHARHTVRSERSVGECRCPDYIVSTNIYQFRR